MGKVIFLIKAKLTKIKDGLVRLNLVSKDIQSISINGVMRNLKDDGLVTTGDKVRRKVVYYMEK